MRTTILILSGLLLTLATPAAESDGTRIVKTLRHLLNLEGRHTTSPSLLDRDAYQAHLREHPEEVSGLRFDIQVRVPRDVEGLRWQLEVRHGSGKEIDTLTQEAPVERRGRRRSFWNQLTVGGKDYENLGEIIAWRVSIWKGETMVTSDESFLW